MAKLEKTITLDYDITGGDTVFLIPLDLSKYKTILFQVNYKDLDVGDSIVKLQRTANLRVNDVPGGTQVLSETGAAKTVDLSVADSAAKTYQIAFTQGTDAAGDVEDIEIVAKTE